MRLSDLIARLRRLGAAPELRSFADAAVEGDVEVIGLGVDSRALRRGEAFIALNGSLKHGLEYLDKAIEAGASVVFWEPDVNADWSAFVAARCRALPAVRVPELRRYLGAFAADYYGDPSAAMPVIGVTGTDGKTSVTQIIAQAMTHLDRRFGVLGTIGNGFPGDLKPSANTTMDVVGVHGELAGLRERGARGVAMEVSSHGLDQRRIDGVHLRGAVLTNLTRDHLDYHGSVEAYADAKRQLFQIEGLDFVVLNVDDAFGRELMASELTVGRKFGYGRADDADVRIVSTAARPDGLDVTIAGSLGSGVIRSHLLGDFNAANLTAAFVVLRELGVDVEAALAALGTVRPVAGRMEAWSLSGGVTAVVDYAHTPAALEHALNALRAHAGGRLHCVFGCGGDRDRGKRPLMGEVAERLADRVVVTDDNPRGEDPEVIIAGILVGMAEPGLVTVERDREAAIRAAIGAARAGDVVLIAGKGHEDYQIVGDRRHWFSDRALVAEIKRERNEEDAR
ncbi:MAG: UDP-N-acetylmuramoyl-L-alanyl-D-glutamate--2,6-diaminopimelate ligase [Chromatiales bacterium]|nr:UDP-N-acetylmuramoyl-L-alanyl-D-glutamate--2,6-diaminopimelate ligase [Gammaproteobacteria bacterium]MCP5352705.1 UDP-N-acetylmuramoyl-L-alanyl-D-glutamate--2,6-diaminopimelate ligase [Chromatiales bacterium]